MDHDGVVLSYGSRGFGFVMDLATRQEFFFHVSGVKGYTVLAPGDHVKFQICPKPGKDGRPVAWMIEPADTPAGSGVRS